MHYLTLTDENWIEAKGQTKIKEEERGKQWPVGYNL